MVVMVTVVAYFGTIAEAKVPVKVGGVVFKMIGGLGLAIGALVALARGEGVGIVGSIAVIAPAAFAAVLAMTLLFFLSQRRTPVGDIKVKVGDTLLAFETTTAAGVPFHTDELAGKRTLLKFFRGGW